MRELERSESLLPQRVTLKPDRLALYEQYGSMAYGIILRILDQPDVAQQVLINLFLCPQLTESSVRSSVIIRLARQMALEARALEQSARTETAFDTEKENLPSLIFDLSFCHGHELKTVAERLQVTYADAVKAIRDHFSNFRTYQPQQR